MNTKLTTRRSTLRTTALAACLLALFGGATACGTEDGAAPAKSGNRPASLSSIDLIEREKANQNWYLHHLKAQRPHAARSQQGYPGANTQPHQFGDDRRQQQTPPSHAPSVGKPPPNGW
jgi:hypothetical protein